VISRRMILSYRRTAIFSTLRKGLFCFDIIWSVQGFCQSCQIWIRHMIRSLHFFYLVFSTRTKQYDGKRVKGGNISFRRWKVKIIPAIRAKLRFNSNKP
jgi:hypothetical protein